MRVKIMSSRTKSELQVNINKFLADSDQSNRRVLDIKFSCYQDTIQECLAAMIIYEDVKVEGN